MSEQNQGPVPPVPPPAPMPPVPQYGEYAPAAAPPSGAVPPAAPGYTYVQVPVYQAGGVPTSPPKRKTWDVVLTIVLLALGLFGMAIGLLYAAVLDDPILVDQTLGPQGYDTDLVDFGPLTAVIAISHVLLYLVAAGVSIPLLVRYRIVVFWIPLAAGVIAAVIFWGGLFAALIPAAPTSYPY
jgi:hypothetical protein